MNDCTNADIRDQLPDLLHDRLTVDVREVVVAHVADCADCREELELLRDVRGALLIRTPRVDVGQIVAALPKPAAHAAPSRRFVRMDWRIAAAVTFLAVGGSSVALLERTPSGNRSFPDSNVVAAIAAPGSAATDSTSTASATAATAATAASSIAPTASGASTGSSEVASGADVEDAADVSPGGRFSGLSETQLKSLLDDIGQLPDVPVTEPDPVTIQVNTTSPDGQ
ncbi:MAG TPA: zf-HC2 domain-containing protein [Gemmatimonadaceae bacterium]|jgi:hypothetical protein